MYLRIGIELSDDVLGALARQVHEILDRVVGRQPLRDLVLRQRAVAVLVDVVVKVRDLLLERLFVL